MVGFLALVPLPFPPPTMLKQPQPPRFADELLSHREFLEDLARRYSTSGDEAHDLVQETYLTALRQPPPRRSGMRPWLATVLRNLAISRHRKESWHVSLGEMAREEGVDADPGRIAERRSVQAKIRRAIEKLDQKYQSVLQLRYFDNLPPRAIASQLSIPVETVRTRHRRALDRLREDLDRSPLHPSPLLSAILPWNWFPRAGEPRPLLALPALIGVVVVAVAAVLFGAFWFGSERGAGDGSSETHPAVSELRSDDFDRSVAVAPPVVVPSEMEGRTPLPVAGGLFLEAVWASDGRAAAGQGFLLEQGIAGTVRGPLAVDRHSLRTDAAGRAHVAELAPGPWKITPAFGKSRWITVDESRLEPQRFELADGLEVMGTVRLPGGAPVAGASVRVSWPNRRELGYEVACTDPTGRFRIEHVDPYAWIGAVADGRHTRSLQSFGELGADGLVRSLDLILHPLDRVLHGTVTDAEGNPIAGAEIVPEGIGSEPRRQDARGLWTVRHVPEGVRADAAGAFALPFDSGWKVDYVVRVDAPGFAHQCIPITLVQRNEGNVQLVLPREARITGTVRDRLGEVNAGAWVALSNSGMMRYDRSDEAGHFAFDSVLPGAFMLLVGGALPWEAVIRHPDEGSFRHSGFATEGETIEIDAERGFSCAVNGVLVDEDANPLSGWRVALMASEGNRSLRQVLTGDTPERPMVRTDAAGGFSFLVPPAGSFALVAYPEGAATTIPHAVRRGLHAGAFVELTASAESRPSVTYRGRVEFVDRDRDLSGVRLMLCSYATSHLELVHPDPETGEFVSPPLNPGCQMVGAYVDGEGYAMLTEVEAASGEDRDLGVVRICPRGTLSFRLLAPGLDDFDDVRLRVTSPFVSLPWSAEIESEIRLEEDGTFSCSVFPGSYRVFATNPQVKGMAQAVEVRGGEVTYFELVMYPRDNPR